MLTEKITLEKYPEYAKYKKRVSRLLPWFTSYRPVSKNISKYLILKIKKIKSKNFFFNM
jgi:hypothetical protein